MVVHGGRLSALLVLRGALSSTLAEAAVNTQLAAARLLLAECPDLHRYPQDVIDLWHGLAATILEAQAQIYVDPSTALESQVRILHGFLTSYAVEVQNVCPGSLMRYFKKAGDAAILAGQGTRCRFLMQWGTTYRIMAVARWYNRLTGNPAWNRDTIPPEAMNFDPEYQGAYDLALQSLHGRYGVQPRILPRAPPPGEEHQHTEVCMNRAGGAVCDSVEVLAVCLYEDSTLPQLAEANHQAYCAHRGYKYRAMRSVPEGGWERLGALPREPHYWKIQQTLDTLEREDGPEWVLVIDCDAFFTNASIGVHDIAAAYGSPTSLFFVAEDSAGINTGVLLFRRHAWTISFLQRVLRTPYVHIWDQSQYFWQLLQEYKAFAMEELAEVPSHIALVHQSHLNAYPSGTAESWNAYGWVPGDYVIHYAGCPWDMQPCWEKMQVSARVLDGQLEPPVS